MAKRDLLTVGRLSPEEIAWILDRSLEHAGLAAGERKPSILAGKGVGLLFEKSSTRTRVSFEMAVWQLGGYPLFLSREDIQVQRGEGIDDSARVLSGYLSALVIRTFEQEKLIAWAEHAAIPVINGLTDLHHPCQALADLFTIRKAKGKLPGLKLAYIGDGNNVAHSLLEAGAKVGMEVAVATPKGFEPDPGIVADARRTADQTGGRISMMRDPNQAAEKADILYTDVWTSMGREKESARRRKAFSGYQINSRLLALAHPEALVMHCLPAHRGEEISADVIDGPQSVVFEQAHNRLPVQKAILEWALQTNAECGLRNAE